MTTTLQPGSQAFHVAAGEDRLAGQIFVGAGVSPRPTCVFLHGIPGVEKNLDIASRLQALGWNAVIWSPRGCWGSTGTYSIEGILDDLTATLAHLRDSTWPIDWQRLALLGYSLGGATALQYVHLNVTNVAALVLVSPVSDFLETSPSQEFLQEASAYLHGTEAQSLSKAWMRQAWEANPIDLAAGIALPTLIIQGAADEVSPAYLSEYLVNALDDGKLVMVPGAGHEFATQRDVLVQIVTAWLVELLGV